MQLMEFAQQLTGQLPKSLRQSTTRSFTTKQLKIYNTGSLQHIGLHRFYVYYVIVNKSK